MLKFCFHSSNPCNEQRLQQPANFDNVLNNSHSPNNFFLFLLNEIVIDIHSMM